MVVVSGECVVDLTSAASLYLLISAPLGVIIVNNWRCLSVCHTPSNCFFCFVSRWNRAIFGPSVLAALYKTLFLDFWFRPHNAKNLHKSHISRLVWQIDRRCLAYQGIFGDGRFNGTMQNVETDPCCHVNEVWARRGDPFAYRLVYTFSKLHWRRQVLATCEVRCLRNCI